MMSGYPSGLTVSAFEMLLHYFYTPADVPGALDPHHQNYRAIKELERAELISHSMCDYGSWKLTERGDVLAKHLMETRLPVSETKWIMPHEQR